MEIVKLLRVVGAEDGVNAALINDQGEEYPVFLEALTNTVYFPLLLESGYKFTGFPCQFKKDGMFITDLPVEEYIPSDAELEDMYNSIGAPTSYDDLKKSMSAEEITSISMPSVNYTITTREEFIAYLDNIESVSLLEDFMPINHFVAPSARFTIEEYISDKYAKYVQIMNNRRVMTLPKFLKLFNWLKQFGLNDNADEMDMLDAYFAWGLDGLNAPIIAKRREQRPQALTGHMHNPVPSFRRTQGFLDSYGNMLTPHHLSGIRWEIPSSSPSYIADATAGLGVGDTIVQAYRCKVPTDVTVMEGPNYNFYYNADCALFLLKIFNSISVQSLVGSGTMPVHLAMPKNRQELVDHCYMEALARMLYAKRRSRVNVSSYKALTICGANPSTALDYIATYDGAYNSGAAKNGESEEIIKIETSDIKAYLNGDTVEDGIKEYMDGVFNGTVNIDNIALAKRSEAQVNISSVYNEIYALHYVFDIPLSEIYNRFSQIDDTSTNITFEYDGLKHTMDVSPLKYSMNGYLSDIQNYDLKNAERCSAFIYILNVAREVGSDDYKRHVGIEFFMVLRRGKVEDLLQKIEKMYLEKIDYTVTDARERAQLEKLKYMFCLSRYFEIALKGTLTWPDRLGGGKVTFSVEDQQEYAKTLNKKIENLTTFCSYTIQGSTASTLSFNLYCTNAYVTPEYVIPRKGYTIHEAAFYALWNNYAATNPQVYAQLVGVGAIPNGFVSWSSRYESEQFVTRDIFAGIAQDSLTHYATKSTEEQNNWPAKLEFTCVEHPIEYLFPGIECEERQEKELEQPRVGAVTLRIGGNRELSYDDMKWVIYPEVKEEEDTQYIRGFAGFSAEAFEICENVISKIPSGDNCNLMVEENNESIYVVDQDRYINFRQITEILNDYDIVHVYDRMYLFKSLNGRLWEVRI